MPERAVVVEDDSELRELLVELLVEAGHEATAFGRGDVALQALQAGHPADVVVTDLTMPGMGGQELLGELRTRHPELNVIVITAFGSIESAIQLVKGGAYDYLTKPVAAHDLLQAVDRALGESRARRELSQLAGSGAGPGAPLMGAAPPLRELRRTIVRIAHSRHPVLIAGESGTGKELVARTL